MPNYKVIAALSLVALAACQPRSLPPVGAAAPGAPAGNQISAAEQQQIPIRVLQQINTLRGNVAAPPLTLNPQLSAAALAHSRDMSAQNRAWHWGSDGSSPLDRARRAGYMGTIVGENISESYENDMQTLSAWMGTRDTRDVIMDPAATNLGFAWYQEPSGKLWWTLLTGS
ncbi:CAP domain-containing protein [Paracoccus shandongensis]|uniref:CAP domain-containing protein n=1 Tax=Paracoccus shandongensis TaxID=2816048 RepID=UPI001A90CB3D|nr:CAP domain-containing protein [Paracoccus shandongensis]